MTCGSNEEKGSENVNSTRIIESKAVAKAGYLMLSNHTSTYRSSEVWSCGEKQRRAPSDRLIHASARLAAGLESPCVPTCHSSLRQYRRMLPVMPETAPRLSLCSSGLLPSAFTLLRWSSGSSRHIVAADDGCRSCLLRLGLFRRSWLLLADCVRVDLCG